MRRATDRRRGDHGLRGKGEYGLPAYPEMPAAGILPPRGSHLAAQDEDQLQRLTPFRRFPETRVDDRGVGAVRSHPYTASAPRSPVRMRRTSSTEVVKFFPSPIRPVLAQPTMGSRVSATGSSRSRGV